MSRSPLGFVIFLAAVASCTPKVPPTAPPIPEGFPRVVSDASSGALLAIAAEGGAGVDDEVLRELCAELWIETLRADPISATQWGHRLFDNRIGDRSAAAGERWHERTLDWHARAQALDPAALSAADQLTRALLLEELEARLGMQVCQTEMWTLSAWVNPVATWNALPEMQPVRSARDAASLLARYRAIAQDTSIWEARLREGLASGRVASRTSLERALTMMRTQLAAPLESWPLLAQAGDEDAAEAEPTWDAAAEAAWRAELTAVVRDEIAPSWSQFADFVEAELIPAARSGDSEGVGALPDGEACYAAAIRRHTTLDRSADELHQTGLDALEAIHAEMVQLGKRSLGTPDLDALFATLRTDPELYFDTPEAVLAFSEQALADAQAAVPAVFGRLPETPCIVVPIPDYQAPYTYIAYYQPPAPDGSRPGQFAVNTYLPETRPKYQARVLAFHESVPGHHFQIAINQELKDLPAFRRQTGMNVFVEGWALYTERLADELELYPTDVDRLGMLTFDAWRASRLVVDTGLHAKGWTRQQAIDFMVSNTALAENNIVNEVDRYLNWPGQALAYKTGQIEILALRAEAEDALGPAFDLAGFHDVVLAAGAVSVPILQQRVRTWVAAQSSVDEVAP